MKQKKKMYYESPCISISKVALESGIAVGVSVEMSDWDDGGTIGETPADEGGDMILIF
jgi:hypothetical protein